MFAGQERFCLLVVILGSVSAENRSSSCSDKRHVMASADGPSNHDLPDMRESAPGFADDELQEVMMADLK